MKLEVRLCGICVSPVTQMLSRDSCSSRVVCCRIIDGQLLSLRWKDWAWWFGSFYGWSVMIGSGKDARSNFWTQSTDFWKLFSDFLHARIKSGQGFCHCVSFTGILAGKCFPCRTFLHVLLGVVELTSALLKSCWATKTQSPLLVVQWFVFQLHRSFGMYRLCRLAKNTEHRIFVN